MSEALQLLEKSMLFRGSKLMRSRLAVPLWRRKEAASESAEPAESTSPAMASSAKAAASKGVEVRAHSSSASASDKALLALFFRNDGAMRRGVLLRLLWPREACGMAAANPKGD